jgi:nitroimidazol reductase NimA-like FMN-containing flavoprotein (pyridoxamine 5'-phosphate oxidase superfamily)
MSPTERTEITRLREKGSTDRAALDALLDSCRLGHFAFVRDGAPVVIPTAVVRDGDRILAHGSTGSPWLRALAGGTATCLAVTAWDGLVIARSAFESSIHYRSAVLFGSCVPVTDTEHALDLITEALLPGRVAELRRPSAKERAATAVVQLPIKEWSLKISAGWPDDPPEDVAGPAWAGVVPLHPTYGAPVPAPDLAAGIPVPPSVRALAVGPDTGSGGATV